MHTATYILEHLKNEDVKFLFGILGRGITQRASYGMLQ